MNGILSNVRHGASREVLTRSNGSLGSEEEDRMSSASDGSYTSYRLTDVEDVNTLARLQEESELSQMTLLYIRIEDALNILLIRFIYTHY